MREGIYSDVLLTKPPKGYVIICFIEASDGFCLVAEGELTLTDRAFGQGAVVKRNLSDAQSGVILSTSHVCDLQPQYTSRVRALLSSTIPGGYSSFENWPQRSEGLPRVDPILSNIPAQELRYWNEYIVGDYVIYQDWIGRVEEVFDDVTVCLQNGTVVVVNGPDELEEPLLLPGTDRHDFVRRLRRLGYNKYQTLRSVKEGLEAQFCPAHPCYPGQMVYTTKNNLRRGEWKFGAYDPNCIPGGIVIDVQSVFLTVRWAFPNTFTPLQDQSALPPPQISADILNSGLIQQYDYSKLPRDLGAHTLPDAYHGPSAGYGRRVRFKDPTGAVLKYSLNYKQFQENFRPRATTKGYDMNIFRISDTRLKCLVQWQDSSITEEASVDLSWYINLDDHDVWPGDHVSLTSAEEHCVLDGVPVIRTRNLGVVQFVDAGERVAQVRWFENPYLVIGGEDQACFAKGGFIGPISERYSITSLYELASYPALQNNRAEMVVIVPYPLPYPPLVNLGKSPLEEWIIKAQTKLAPGRTDLIDADPFRGLPPDIHWFGQIVDLSLDGRLLVRLGAMSEARDILISPERVIVIPDGHENPASSQAVGYQIDSSSGSDEMSITAEGSEVTVDVEYEGGNRLDKDQDDTMWTTDDEEESTARPQDTSRSTTSQPPDDPVAGAVRLAPDTPESGNRGSLFSCYPTMPPQFDTLESPVPTSHHYYHSTGSFSALTMRRITKEYSILKNSLPDGIFARTWENRLDLLRILIVGPRDTPYELAPFVIDLHLGANFPNAPPSAFFHSWTDGIGRINPNLYEDGKICLSILGTWPAGKANEGWSAKGSTILQIIVSIMGLVLVKEPYYNEAGFDILMGSEESRTTSAQYTEKAFVLAKRFVKTALVQLPEGIEDIIQWLYLPSQPGPHLLNLVVEESKTALARSIERIGEPTTPNLDQNAGSSHSAERLSCGASVLLKRTLDWLQQYLQELQEHQSVVDTAMQLDE